MSSRAASKDPTAPRLRRPHLVRRRDGRVPLRLRHGRHQRHGRRARAALPGRRRAARLRRGLGAARLGRRRADRRPGRGPSGPRAGDAPDRPALRRQLASARASRRASGPSRSWRFLGGIAVGAASVIAPAYIAEVAPGAHPRAARIAAAAGDRARHLPRARDQRPDRARGRLAGRALLVRRPRVALDVLGGGGSRRSSTASARSSCRSRRGTSWRRGARPRRPRC